MYKLLAIQSELKAGKDLRNSFGNYNYRSCESILESLKHLLVKHESKLVLSDEIVNIGTRFYVKATAIFSNKDESHTVTAYAREEETKKGMDGSQITGASSSYARKYALNGLFLIDDNKDSDSTNDHGAHNREAKSVPMVDKIEKSYTTRPRPVDKPVDSTAKSSGVEQMVSITSVERDPDTKVYWVNAGKDGNYKTNKEVVSLMAKGRINKGPTKILMTVDADMERVILDVLI